MNKLITGLLLVLFVPGMLLAQQNMLSIYGGANSERFSGQDPYGINNQGGFYERVTYERTGSRYFGFKTGLELIQQHDQTYVVDQSAPFVAAKVGRIDRIYIPLSVTYNLSLSASPRWTLALAAGFKAGIITNRHQLNDNWNKTDDAMMQTSVMAGNSFDFRYINTNTLSLISSGELTLGYNINNKWGIIAGGAFNYGLSPYLTKEIKSASNGSQVSISDEKYSGTGIQLFCGIRIQLG